MKKSLSILLLLCMLIGMFGGVSAFAIEGEETVNETLVIDETTGEEPVVEITDDPAEEPVIEESTAEDFNPVVEDASEELTEEGVAEEAVEESAEEVTVDGGIDLNPHTHCFCGSKNCEGSGHNNSQSWTKWNSTNSLPTTAGYYCLTDDVTIGSTWEPVGDTYLCLNGHVIRMTGSGSVIQVNENVNLTITDCKTDAHYFSVGENGLWTLNATAASGTALENLTTAPATGTVIQVNGGVITGGNAAYGAGVYMDEKASFTMYGGSICGNTASGGCGGGVYNYDRDSTFTMYGGSVCGNIAGQGGGIYGSGEGTVMVSGGGIIGNTAEYGGGIFSFNAFVTVTESTNIVGNSAGIQGGGVYVSGYNNTSGPDALLVSGSVKITGNTAGRKGGGIYIEKSSSAGVGTSNPKLTLTGSAEITGNTANSQGGGVYIAGTDVILSVSGSPIITGNTMDTKANNLYLPSGSRVKVPAIFNGSIGVTTEIAPTVSSSVSITATSTMDYSSRFFSDNVNYAIMDDKGFNTHQVKLAAVVAKNITKSEYYATVQAAVNAAGAGNVIQMIANSTENVEIAAEKNITLDLNGFVLNAPSAGGSVIISDGELTIKDSNSGKQTHRFSVGSDGLWTLDETNGTETVTGGVITGGTGTEYSGSTRGGAIYSKDDLTITGGNIVGNTAQNGGGVYGLYGSVNFSGTTNITGNTAENGGGVNISCYLKMNGGSICRNTATVSGGGIYGYGMTLGDNVTITENTVGTINNDVHLSSSSTIDLNEPAWTTPIYVTTDYVPTLGSPVSITSASNADYSGCFESSNDEFFVINDGAGSAQAVKLAVFLCYIDADNDGSCGRTETKCLTISEAVTAAANGQTIRMLDDAQEKVSIPNGKTITLDLNGHVLRAHLEKTPVYIIDSSVIYIDSGANLTILDSNNSSVHYFTVGENGLWTLDDTKTTGTAVEDLTACPQTGDVIKVTGGCITGGTGEGIGMGGAIYAKGNLTMTGGSIVGNRCYYGSAVYVETGVNADVNLMDVNVCGNFGGYGSGLYFRNKGSVNIKNCNIIANTASDGYGAVYAEKGTVTLEDCTIQNNISGNYGAVSVLSGATLKLVGTTAITANKLSNGTAANLYLISNKTVTMLSGFSGEVGVTTQNVPTSGSPVPVTGKIAQDKFYAQYFRSDRVGYTVKNVLNNGEIEVQLVKIGTDILPTVKVKDCTIESIDKQNYTGRPIEPSLTVRDGNIILVEGTDYTVTYQNNLNVGTATAVITGMGDYTGTTEVTFSIVKSAVNQSSAKKQAPDTGDNSALGLWIGLVSFSVVALGAALSIRRKEN